MGDRRDVEPAKKVQRCDGLLNLYPCIGGNADPFTPAADRERLAPSLLAGVENRHSLSGLDMICHADKSHATVRQR